MNDAIVHFVIGSSPILTLFPYIGLYSSFHQLPDNVQDLEWARFQRASILLPLLSGTFFAILYSTLSIIPRKTKEVYTRFIVCGALAMTFVSIVYDYVFQIQSEWMHLENTIPFHVLVFIFYLVTYYTVGQWLRGQLLYGPTTTSSSSVKLPQTTLPQPTASLVFDKLEQQYKK
jgi:hypothetical protein